MTGGWRDHPLLRFPDFRRLFLGRLVSAVGDKVFTIALAWWVVSGGSEGSKAQLGLLMAVNLAPVVLLGPLLGVVADRRDRRACMLAADAARAALVGLLCWGLLGGWLNLPLMYLLVFATAAFAPLFDSAVGSALADLTDPVHLDRAVAVDGLVVNLSAALGAFAGSVLLALLGVPGAFLLNALSFLVSFAAVLRLRTPLPARAGGEPFRVQLAAGFAYALAHRPILALTATFALLNFFAAPVLLFIPLLVKFRLGAGASWVALFEGALALGSVGAGLALSFRNPFRRAYPAMFAAVALMGLALLGLGVTHHRAALFLLFLLSGTALAVVNTLALARFQAWVPAPMKGRFFAILNTACFAAMPLSFVVNGLATQYLSLDALILLNGGLTLALALPILLIPRLPDAGQPA